MRILTVVFRLSKGGTERAAANFALAFKELGHDSRVAVLITGGDRERQLAESGIPIVGLESLSVWFDRAGWQPDLIHLHNTGLEAHHVDSLIAQASPGKTVLVEHNHFGIPSPWEKKLKNTYQISRWGLWQYYKRGGDVRKAKLLGNPIIEYAVRPPEKRAARQSLGIRSEGLVVGRVGQAYPRKWSLRYFSVLKEVSKHRALTFVSVNPPEFLAEKLSRLSNLTHRSFPKVLDDTMLSRIYASMDVMLHIADNGECQSYALLEATAHGVPIVTLATPWADNGQTETVKHGKNGFVVQRSKNLAPSLLRAVNANFRIADTARENAHQLNSVRLAQQVLQDLDEANWISSARVIPRPNYESVEHTRWWDFFWSRIPRRVAWIISGQIHLRSLISNFSDMKNLLNR